MEYRFSDRVQTLKPSAIREIFKYAADPSVISLSAGNPAPEAFPAKEVAEIAKAKTEAIVTAYTNGLLNVDTAQKELKGLGEETGVFGNLSDEEIEANKGKSYQDATALRDPLMGLR